MCVAQRGAQFFNTSRGELIEETAFLDNLTSGKLAGAVLDVLCDEHLLTLAEQPKSLTPVRTKTC
jgi:phosphoglycerate dehydrogenase-like enzyme